MKENPNEFFEYVWSKKNIEDTFGPLSNEDGTLINDSKEITSLSN